MFVGQSQLVLELQRKVGDLQLRLTDVESSAENHLHSLATHTQSAIDAAQLQLTSADEQLREHLKFIKV